MLLRRSRVLPALLLCAAVSAGCSGATSPRAGGGPSAGAGPSATSSLLPPKEGGPLTSLQACKPPPKPAADAKVDGLMLPPGSVITEVSRGDKLVTVKGYVALTPVRVRQYYQSQTQLEFFEIEDEVAEAEAFFANATHRNYVKVTATCAEGSRLVAVVAPEVKKK